MTTEERERKKTRNIIAVVCTLGIIAITLAIALFDDNSTPTKPILSEAEVEFIKLEAKRGKPNYMAELGWMYYYGEGVNLNRNTALNWFRKAHNKGAVEGTAGYGLMHCTDQLGYGGYAGQFDRGWELLNEASGKGSKRASDIIKRMR